MKATGAVRRAGGGFVSQVVQVSNNSGARLHSAADHSWRSGTASATMLKNKTSTKQTTVRRADVDPTGVCGRICQRLSHKHVEPAHHTFILQPGTVSLSPTAHSLCYCRRRVSHYTLPHQSMQYCVSKQHALAPLSQCTCEQELSTNMVHRGWALADSRTQP